MERVFEIQKWNKVRRERHDQKQDITAPREPEMLATGCFASPNDGCHVFTVFPHEDLFHLTPHNLDTLDWRDIDSASVPMLGSSLCGFQGHKCFFAQSSLRWMIGSQGTRVIVGVLIWNLGSLLVNIFEIADICPDHGLDIGFINPVTKRIVNSRS